MIDFASVRKYTVIGFGDNAVAAFASDGTCLTYPTPFPNLRAEIVGAPDDRFWVSIPGHGYVATVYLNGDRHPVFTLATGEDSALGWGEFVWEPTAGAARLRAIVNHFTNWDE